MMDGKEKLLVAHVHMLSTVISTYCCWTLPGIRYLFQAPVSLNLASLTNAADENVDLIA